MCKLLKREQFIRVSRYHNNGKKHDRAEYICCAINCKSCDLHLPVWTSEKRNDPEKCFCLSNH